MYPHTNVKQHHPKDIADAFSHYYESLYNLAKDPQTHQPNSVTITNFLAKLFLPQLTEQLQRLNLPFWICRNN